MDKRIKMTDEQMINYFIKEQKVMEYGEEIFDDVCSLMIINSNNYVLVDNQVLPLSCYNAMEEYIAAVESGNDYAIAGGFVNSGRKQAYIRIGIDANDSVLDEELKQIIRHEIIHYYLWLVDLAFEDDNLDFWCLCHAYDAGAYEELTADDEDYYNLFADIYDTYVASLPWNVKHLITGQLITGLSEKTMEEYSEYAMGIIEHFKEMYGIE